MGAEKIVRVLRLTTEDAETAWSRVDDGGIFVGDIVDEAGVPNAKMTFGFARVAKGEALDISFPHDEVLIVTKGLLHRPHRARRGDHRTRRRGDLPARWIIELRPRRAGRRDGVRASPPAVCAYHVAATTAGPDS